MAGPVPTFSLSGPVASMSHCSVLNSRQVDGQQKKKKKQASEG